MPFYGIGMAIFGFLGAVVAKQGITKIAKKYNSQSIFIFTLMIVLILAFIMDIIMSTIKMIYLENDGESIFTFNHFC